MGIRKSVNDDFTPFVQFAIIGLYQLTLSINLKGGERMVADMGMTNKQFQGFIRLALELIDKALIKSPDNDELQKLKDIFQSMLEDGN